MPAHSAYRALVVVLVILVLAGCGATQTAPPLMQPDLQVAQAALPAPTAGPRPTAQPLTAGRGQEIGFVYEGFLSPQQEPGEEEDAPSFTPQEFLSTAPSVPRNQRYSRGHGQVRFTKDLSKAYVDVQVEGINPADVVMFHIHCGRPDMLGPILIDFSFSGSLQEQLADGVLSVELTNADIAKVTDASHGPVGAFTTGCPVVPGIPGDSKTIASMQYIAQQGELYFNLHTKGQTFYGEMRGQIHQVER
jgi:hypothetical protein